MAMGLKEKKELIILSVGVTILIAIWVIRQMQAGPASTGSPRPPVGYLQTMPEEAAPVAETVAGEKGTSQPVIEGVSIKYTGRENRDPLDNSVVVVEEEKPEAVQETPPEKKIFPIESFLISAVIWDSKRPQAIVNDRVVNVGEALDGGTIVAIDKRGVHVAFEGDEYLLAMQ